MLNLESIFEDEGTRKLVWSCQALRQERVNEQL